MARDTVAEIKDKLSIQDVVAPYVKLKRAGKSVVGLCPFHKEKTPSFHISPERGTYHCFGCGEGGDAFSFIEKVEGVDFKGALKILADKAGVEIEYAPAAAKEAKSRTERLREAMLRATEFYSGQLAEGGAAYAYALKRGLTKETIRDWQLGFAPDGWRGLLEHLATKGFTAEELASAGLIKEADGKKGTWYDRFRNRLMFPIRDVAGRTIAFTGRALSSEDEAKYLNSPETDLYHKSDVLFGMDRAKEAIRTRGFTMLVEGQLDLLLSHQTGFTNAVALSGTALTTKHLGLMKRYAPNLMLVLDADTAGLTATAKSAVLALREGLKVKAARLPKGKDPADLISEDPKAFAQAVKDAKPIVEFFLAVLSEGERDSHKLALAVERVVLPLIAAIQSPIEQEHFVAVVARALALSPEAVRGSLARLPKEQPVGSREQGAVIPKKELKKEAEARALTLQAVVAAYPKGEVAKHVKERYSQITEAPFPLGDAPESALFAVEQIFGDDPTIEAVDELLRAFEAAIVREAYQESVGELRRAEAVGDETLIKKAQAACVRLSSRLSALHA